MATREQIQIGWLEPGSSLTGEGPQFDRGLPEAAVVRDCGGKVVFRIQLGGGQANVPHEFYVYRSGTDDFTPWHVAERVVVGTRGALESSLEVDAFARYADACADAKDRCREALAHIAVTHQVAP